MAETGVCKNNPFAEKLEGAIEALWKERKELTPAYQGPGRQAVSETLDLLDVGTLRVAEKHAHGWCINPWVKKAILLSFKLNDFYMFAGKTSPWYDKIPLKFNNWTEDDFKKGGFRLVPGSLVRHGAYIGKNVILMPSFVNIGAYVGEGTMIDTWSTIGTCAQIGRNCHISGGVGIGGVLEPLQANPVIIEDNCFIGARAEIAEGVVVEEGSVISMGVYLSASTKIIDRETGETHKGRVPAGSVVVSGNLPGKPFPDGTPGPGLYCAVIVKKVDEKTRSKTSINDLLREIPL